MSQPSSLTRYSIEARDKNGDSAAVMVRRDPDGAFTYYSRVAALEAENRRLREAATHAIARLEHAEASPFTADEVAGVLRAALSGEPTNGE